VRAKTFESIATATGETIHWVGNKAAPIPACVSRVREDMGAYLYLARELITQAGYQDNPLAHLVIEAANGLQQRVTDLDNKVNKLRNKSPEKLRHMLDMDSVLEDLYIIEQSANTILQIKEDLIGPARRQRPQPTDLVQVVKENIRGFGLAPGVVSYSIDGSIPRCLLTPPTLAGWSST